MTEFDDAAHKFTTRLRRASLWQDTYFGAAYATRLRQAIAEAREACAEMEVALEKDK